MAPTNEKRVYEGMFLVDPAVAAMWDNLTKHLRGILERQGAQVLGITRWDERKLAYPVKRQKRGTYVLVFFALQKTDGLPEIERDCQLSDQILRALIVRADQFSLSDMRLQLGEDMDQAVAQALAAERGESIAAQPGAGIRVIERHAREDSGRDGT